MHRRRPVDSDASLRKPVRLFGRLKESLGGAKLLATEQYVLAGDSLSFRAIRITNGELVWKNPANNVQLVASDGTAQAALRNRSKGWEYTPTT